MSNTLTDLKKSPTQQAAEQRGDLLSNSTIQFLDKLQVLRMLSVSPTGLHDLMLKAAFPRPRVLGADPMGISGKSYWLRFEVEQWMLSRPRRVLKCDLWKEIV
jgi:predicted DNA-binding transcriptional regulator AlpA